MEYIEEIIIGVLLVVVLFQRIKIVAQANQLAVHNFFR